MSQPINTGIATSREEEVDQALESWSRAIDSLTAKPTITEAPPNPFVSRKSGEIYAWTASTAYGGGSFLSCRTPTLSSSALLHDFGYRYQHLDSPQGCHWRTTKIGIITQREATSLSVGIGRIPS